jgi:hypothetical protein
MKRVRQRRSLTSPAADNRLPRLRWAAHRTLERMGRLGVAALALLVAILAFDFAIQMPRAVALSQDKASQLAQLKPQPHAADRSPAARLRTMLDGDPSAQKLALFETLRQYGIEVRESTYRKDDEVKGKLERWSMDIAMKGRYADLAHALHVFADEPLLRVDALTMARSRIEDDKLDISLRISLLGGDS